MYFSSQKSKITNIEFWRNSLGLFPMPLFKDKYQQEKFILLNGGVVGNFCLDFKNQDGIDVRNYAWSADVGHYLSVDKNFLYEHRWNTNTVGSVKHDLSKIEAKIEIFYDYLRKQDIGKQDSVVKFVLEFYRRIRSFLRDDIGDDSLNTLLFLLACVAEGNVDRKKLSIQKWGIKDIAKQSVESIKDSNWDELVDLFNTGLKLKNLRPNIDLILRHVSGSLFQEAHFEMLFPIEYQTSFPGFITNQEPIKNDKTRKQTSAHFTPTSIVRTIVEESLREFSFSNKKEITVLDPACGSGEFLKEFIRQVRLIGYRGKVNLIGWDISDTAVGMSKFTTNYEVIGQNDLSEIKIIKRDALEEGNSWNIGVDFLLMNPPFISWEIMDSNQQSKIKSLLGDISAQRPNMAGAFLWNAINCLNDGGVIGCVLPTSIFEASSYMQMRGSIKEQIDIKTIGRLGSHSIFSEALVDAAVFIGIKNIEKSNSPIILWSDFRPENSSLVLREFRKTKQAKSIFSIDEPGYSIYKNSELLNSDKWMPIPLRSYELLARNNHLQKVEEIFSIKQGVRTGLNSVFIVPEQYYKKLPRVEKKYFKPTVTNDSIVNHKLYPSYYIFYAEGDCEIKSKTGLMKAVPTYFRDYLKTNIILLSSRARKDETDFWKLSEPRAWARKNTPKILSTEFGRAGSFVFDHTGEFIPERSHAWLPKNKYSLEEIGYAYVTVLAMPIIDNFLMGLSKQIGGGQWYLSSQFINKMPLPNLFDNFKDQGLLKELIDLGIQLSNGNMIDDSMLIEKSKFLFND